jgi:DNA-binding winged helix-turn-helix (wHTH) protein
MTNSLSHTLDDANRAIAEQSLEFGRFQVLPRQRLLLADGAPIDLGTRAFELLLTLLEANGALVAKEHLLARVWPGVVVGQDNLKTQVFALRRALGKDRDFIRTEFGRGYRFTAAVRSTVAGSISPCPIRGWLRSTQSVCSQQITRGRGTVGRFKIALPAPSSLLEVKMPHLVDAGRRKRRRSNFWLQFDHVRIWQHQSSVYPETLEAETSDEPVHQ